METAMQTCYRHKDRRAGVVCQRCDRPICPDCMRQASVGFHCPECTKAGAQKIVRPRELLRPVATQALVVINVVIFVVGIGAGLKTRAQFSYDWGLFGPFVANGDWYRLITSAFLHANLIHVGLNMYVLWRLGELLEPALGRWRFTLVYAVSLLGGSLGVMLLDPNALTVGASGAVFGLMGAAIGVFRSRGLSVMDSGLGALIFLNLAFTFAVPGISIGGHIGGLLTGYLAGELLHSVGPKYLKDPSLIVGSVAALGALAFGASLLVA